MIGKGFENIIKLISAQAKILIIKPTYKPFIYWFVGGFVFYEIK